MSQVAIVGSSAGPASDVIRVYVWEVPVRVTHWLVVASIAVLAATGFYIGHPFISVSGPARDHFVMGTMKVVHFYAAIVFVLAVLARVAWMFMGNRYARWNQFIPISPSQLRDALRVLQWYFFVRRTPTRSIGHNPLAGATYLLVFLVYFLMIATGFGLYSVSASVTSPMRAFRFLVPLLGGLQSARWIHHVGMWLIIAWFPHHLYSAWAWSVLQRDATTESMFSGYKTVSRKHLLEGSDD